MKNYITLALLSFVLLTNTRLGWDAGIDLLCSDVRSYEIIAKAAPGLPNEMVLYHHAQRLFSPYIAGAFSKTFGIPYQTIFSVLTGACILATLLFLHKIFSRLSLSRWDYILCMSALILNPFLFRFYIIVPGMLPDVLFMAGLAAMLFGLINKKIGIVLAGSPCPCHGTYARRNRRKSPHA